MNDHRLPARLGHRPRAGFTLVELLVVIAIIGILVSLLLPAVQSARQSSMRTQCSNNLYQLGRGVLAHEAAVGWYPTGGWGWNWVGDADRGAGLRQPGGWIYNTLPFVDQKGLHDMGAGQPASTKTQIAVLMVQTAVPLFYCPARRAPKAYPTNGAYSNCASPPSAAKSDYAASQGDARNYDEANPGPDNMQEVDSNTWSWPDTSSITGISFLRSMVTPGAVTDGTSNTYFGGEKYLNPDEYFTGSSASDNESAYQGWDNDNYRDASGVNPPLQDTPGVMNTFDFGAIHPVSCYFVFCDGSVHAISYSIDAETHRRLANRADGLTVDPSMY